MKVKIYLLMGTFILLAGCTSAQMGIQAETPSNGSVDDSVLTWTIVPQNPMLSYVESVAYGNGKFIAVGRKGREVGPNRMAYSTDGITWTATSVLSGYDFEIDNITFCGGRFFVSGWPGSMASSIDGENWTVVVSNLREDFRGPVYGDGKWVFVTYEGRIMYSTDGVTWKNGVNRSSVSQFTGVGYGGGKFVATSWSGGKMAYSTDGITWTVVPEVYGTGPIRGIAYGDGKFVVGGWGRIFYSADGVTWTEVMFSEGSTFYDSPVLHICYGGGKFVATGDGNRMAYSTDGITWTGATFDLFSGEANVRGIVFGNARFVAVGMSLKEWGGWRTTDDGRIVYSNMQE